MYKYIKWKIVLLIYWVILFAKHYEGTYINKSDFETGTSSLMFYVYLN